MPLAYNSYIAVKLQTCEGCGVPAKIFSRKSGKALCHTCAAQNRKPIAKISEKRLSALQEESEEVQPFRSSQHSAVLERWFKERHSEMTGTCMHCGGKSSKGTPLFKCSIAHILPKSLFPSVATHPLNWLELCFWGQSCHTNLDNYILDITELHCFDAVIERFIAMYPFIAEKEKRRIPPALLQYINIDL